MLSREPFGGTLFLRFGKAVLTLVCCARIRYSGQKRTVDADRSTLVAGLAVTSGAVLDRPLSGMNVREHSWRVRNRPQIRWFLPPYFLLAL